MIIQIVCLFPLAGQYFQIKPLDFGSQYKFIVLNIIFSAWLLCIVHLMAYDTWVHFPPFPFLFQKT